MQRGGEARVALRRFHEVARHLRRERVRRTLDVLRGLGIQAAQAPARPPQLRGGHGGRLLEERVGAHRLATAGTAPAGLRRAGARPGRCATNWNPVNMTAIPTSSPR